MKKQILIALALLGTLTAGRASLYFQGTGVGSGTDMGAVASSAIVDGNPAIVIANSMTLSGLGSSISSLTVNLNITGGYNNGLYAYLVHGGTTVTLMNQPGYALDGYGATGAGMNIALSDTSIASIQSETSGSVLGGTYHAAGNLSDFNGIDPNSSWTLYFSDTLAGGGNATLNGWSLDITAVPEPINVAMAIFGSGFIGFSVIRRYLGARKAEIKSDAHII